jgi:plastocyanin
MSDTTIFYILGLSLVASALIIAAIGLRKDDFPSPAVLKGVLPLFAALVIATMTFAIRNSNAEHDKTVENREAAAKLQEVDLTNGVSEADNPDSVAPSTGQATPEQSAAPAKASEKLDVTSPASGELKFDPPDLSTKAGTLEIDYDNPSPVPHSIALADPSGTILDESEIGASQTFSITADVKPGTYLYYCTVPGHREAGMEGKLTVK